MHTCMKCCGRFAALSLHEMLANSVNPSNKIYEIRFVDLLIPLCMKLTASNHCITIEFAIYLE